MTVQEIRAFKVDLLDSIKTLATEPVPNDDEIKAEVEAFFGRLEKETLTLVRAREDRSD